MSLLIAFSQRNGLWKLRGDLENSLTDSAEQESAPDRPRFLGQGVPRFLPPSTQMLALGQGCTDVLEDKGCCNLSPSGRRRPGQQNKDANRQ